jgi:hypothetical protein
VSSAVALIELLLIFGLVMGLGVWELLRTRRAMRRREDDDGTD